MLKRNRTIIIGPAVVINHSQAERLGSKNGNKCTFTLEFQQREESKADNRGLKTSTAKEQKRELQNDGQILLQAALDFDISAKRKGGQQFKLISPLNYNNSSGLQAMHCESLSCVKVICWQRPLFCVSREKFLTQRQVPEQSLLSKLFTTFTILINSMIFVTRK